MLTSVDRGRGLRFPVFGFPVRVDITFFLIAAFLGFSADSFDLGLAVTWFAVLGGSVLAHELGHAFAARSLGAEPDIVIHGMGGYTSYVPTHPPTRLQSVGVSLAGPAAGFGFGLVILAVALVAPSPAENSLTDYALRAAIFINLGWGLVNLLPVLPLDGGHILVQLLPGDERLRLKRAAVVSVVAALGGAVGMWVAGLPFGAVLFAMLVATNLASVRSASEQLDDDDENDEIRSALVALGAGDPAAIDRVRGLIATTRREPLRVGLKSTLVEYLAVSGQLPDSPSARDELDNLPGQVEPVVYALVNLSEQGHGGDVTELIETFQRAPSVVGARAVVLGATHVGRPETILPAFEDGPPGCRAEPVLAFAQDAAHRRGAYDVAVGLGLLLLRTHPDTGPVPRYNLACSLARLGEADAAVASLDDAISRGWTDGERVDADPDLAAARLVPAYAGVRGRLG